MKVGLSLLGLACLSLLVSACGGSPGPRVAAVGRTTTAGTTTSVSPAPSTHEEAALAFSRCMRAHGVPNFPDPDGHGTYAALSEQALGVSKETTLVAQHACGHLLASLGSSAPPGVRQAKLAFGLEVARCLRAHGYPNFPDPGSTGQALPAGTDPSSPAFQAAQTACEKPVPKPQGPK